MAVINSAKFDLKDASRDAMSNYINSQCKDYFGDVLAASEEVGKEVAKEAGIEYFELTMNPDRPVLHRLYIQKAGFYKKAELTPHPHKHEPRWLLRYDL